MFVIFSGDVSSPCGSRLASVMQDAACLEPPKHELLNIHVVKEHVAYTRSAEHPGHWEACLAPSKMSELPSRHKKITACSDSLRNFAGLARLAVYPVYTAAILRALRRLRPSATLPSVHVRKACGRIVQSAPYARCAKSPKYQRR